LFASLNTVGTFFFCLFLFFFFLFPSVSKFHSLTLLSDSDEAAETHSQQATTGNLSMLSLAWLLI